MTLLITETFPPPENDPVDVAPSNPRLGYLPGLDGLRAVAVAAVFAYHLDLSWARGGFLGVDLFFVISGYLITTLLVMELDHRGRVGLRSFWLRRFRRLVPPVVVMVTAVVVATRVWGVPQQWEGVRVDAAASIGYVANWRFVLGEQSYFDTLLGPSPLRHMWSLAVEEQWYLVWPLLLALFGTALGTGRARRWIAAAVIAAGAVASAVWMAALYLPSDPSRAYYGTDTRAQQLLVGAALAVALPLVPRLARVLGSTSIFLAALAVFVAVASTTRDDAAWLYRGGFLAVSTLCALVLVGVVSPQRRVPGLEAPPVLWLGRRSYGVYLWHWPVIVFVGAPMGIRLDGVSLMIVQVLLTLLLAELSHRLVESPARWSPRSPAQLFAGWSLAAGACVLAALMLLVAPVDRRQMAQTVLRPTADDSADAGAGPLSDVPPASTPPAGDTAGSERTGTAGVPRSSNAEFPNAESSNAESPNAESPNAEFPNAEFPNAELPNGVSSIGGAGAREVDNDVVASVAPKRLLLLGDSTALVVGIEPPEDPQWVVQGFARLGCAITDGRTIDVDATRSTTHTPECDHWRRDWSESATLVDPEVVVVMVGAWEVLDHVVDGDRRSFPESGWVAVIEEALQDVVETVVGPDRTVVLLTLPCMEQRDNTSFSAQARNDEARVAAFNRIVERVAARTPRVTTAPLADLLCPAGTPRGGHDSTSVRYDGVHLTSEGVDIFWDWLLDEVGPHVDAQRASGPNPSAEPSSRPR